jgi:hypothetical protein
VGAAASTVEQMFVDFQFLKSISIDPATGQAEGKDTGSLLKPYNLSAGRPLPYWDRLFVTYTYGLNQSDLQHRVALELDILRGLLLASAWETRAIPSRQEHSDAAQNAFELDLKFRYEH